MKKYEYMPLKIDVNQFIELPTRTIIKELKALLSIGFKNDCKNISNKKLVVFQLEILEKFLFYLKFGD